MATSRTKRTPKTAAQRKAAAPKATGNSRKATKRAKGTATRTTAKARGTAARTVSKGKGTGDRTTTRVKGTARRPAPAKAPQAPPLLEARSVVKTYRTGAVEVQALRGVDLQVRPGEMVAVVGPSGCGKTTLLNSLSGLDDIDSGEVWIAGEEIHGMSDRRRTAYRSRSMGFIFQSFNLIPVFSAVENVELPLLLSGRGPKDARLRAIEVLCRVGLGERLHHRPPELSGGEQQRVAIARALAPEPAVIWADEPTGNLDSTTAGRVMELVHELNDGGLTVVLVTHDTGIARAAPRLVTMRDGVIVGDEQRR